MKSNLKSVLQALALSSACLAGHAVAEEMTVADGVFTEAQVAAGKQVYDNQCSTCHNMRFYEDTLRSWNNQPLLYLWETVLGTMPADNPGSLMFDEYTDVMAYILNEAGFPTGEIELDPDVNMGSISIVTP